MNLLSKQYPYKHNKGNIVRSESEVLGMVALYLNIPVERMRIILTAFLIRNKWNVQIIEEMHK
jgi:hypothetical protein